MINDPAASGPNGILNDPKGILSTASARSDMCFCLGLIDKTVHGNSKAIAFIRNQFAHSHVPIDFNKDDIKQKCGALAVWIGDMTINPPGPLDAKKKEKLKSKPRVFFVLATCWTFLEIQKATFTATVENETGNVDIRVRKHPEHCGGRLFLNIQQDEEGKLILGSNVLLDE